MSQNEKVACEVCGREFTPRGIKTHLTRTDCGKPKPKKVDKDSYLAPVNMSPKSRDGKRAGRVERFQVGQFKNKFNDNGKLCAEDSVKVNPLLGTQTQVERGGQKTPIVEKVCDVCHRTVKVRASELSPPIGGVEPLYRCDRCYG